MFSTWVDTSPVFYFLLLAVATCSLCVWGVTHRLSGIHIYTVASWYYPYCILASPCSVSVSLCGRYRVYVSAVASLPISMFQLLPYLVYASAKLFSILRRELASPSGSRDLPHHYTDFSRFWLVWVLQDLLMWDATSGYTIGWPQPCVLLPAVCAVASCLPPLTCRIITLYGGPVSYLL